MIVEEILNRCDHTVLSQTAMWEDIKSACDDGIRYNTASVCIPSCYVKRAADYVAGRVALCTVVGFPNGYSTSEAKCFEASEAIKAGADEIDMVINIGELKAKNYIYVLEEIKAVKKVCGEHILKVIVETCLLSEEEKIKMCEIVTESAADYIKTSTGFSLAGAVKEDIELFSRYIGSNVKIKAAGGIKSLADAQEFIDLGASRLGTSRIVQAVKSMEGKMNDEYANSSY